MTDYDETEDYEAPYEGTPFYDEDDVPVAEDLSDEELAYLAQAWLDSQEARDAGYEDPSYSEGFTEPEHQEAWQPQEAEAAVLTRLQLADQAERQIRSEFPGLPEDDVSRIRNAFFDTRYSPQDLATSFQGQTHLAYAALAYQEAAKSGRLRGTGAGVPGRSPIAGIDMQSGIAAEDRPTYEKWVQAFGKAYMVDGKVDHRMARRRFREATSS